MQQLRDQSQGRLKSPPQQPKSILKVRSPKDEISFYGEERPSEMMQEFELD